MEIYRLEHDGKGVYHSGIVYRLYDTSRGTFDPLSPPGPHNDWGIRGRFKRLVHYCGFKDLEQYRQWFSSPAFRKRMAEQGVKLIKYKVPKKHVIIGEHQTVFVKSRAEKIAEYKPTRIKETKRAAKKSVTVQRNMEPNGPTCYASAA